MLCKRIIPCLDIKNGRTVKGVNFEHIKDAGDPVELAIRYAEQGADELVFLDISATEEKRKTLLGLVDRVASNINIPFTVGGGIASIEDVSELLNAGADKVSVNSAAYRNKNLINEIASRFGSQCLVAAIDIKFENKDWFVYLSGGKVKTGSTVLDWAREVEQRGAGEILLTSMNSDGTENGFSNEVTAAISNVVNIPVIASGGAGRKEHFLDVFNDGNADAALAASVFHYGKINIAELKNYLKKNNINVR